MKKYALIIPLFLILPALAGANDDSRHMMDWYGWGGFGMFIFPILWILLIGGIIFLAIRAFGKPDGRPGQDKSKSALEILKERYAQGEINKEQFEKMKKDIGG